MSFPVSRNFAATQHLPFPPYETNVRHDEIGPRPSGMMRAVAVHSDTSMPLSRAAASACLALSMALVGSYVALSKPLVAVFPVFLLAWLRFGIGAVAMGRWLRKPAGEPPVTPRTRLLLFLESFLGNFLFSICMLFGVSMTTAVAA